MFKHVKPFALFHPAVHYFSNSNHHLPRIIIADLMGNPIARDTDYLAQYYYCCLTGRSGNQS